MARVGKAFLTSLKSNVNLGCCYYHYHFHRHSITYSFLRHLNLPESRAIARYVARKYESSGPDLLREGNLRESAMVDLWLEVESQQYNPAISSIVNQYLIIPIHGGVPDQKLIDANVEKLGMVLDVYEDHLSKTKFFAGDFFSLADLDHLPYTQYLMATPYASLFESRPHVKAWWEELSSRPAARKTTAAMPKSG
ncbi:probable glutathione S-transferase GSTF1 [Elaeis guineensis]|uniref:glutathione transferase n=1 Tax=Elaeis guineensis var. tenera TaxID=51953 RepID=A0A6I9Q8T7_ELAGV|nr:probable glutathione S-transferase GSTF1 [Elaeis guineensis]